MKTVLITGATDGIGRETARGMLAKGWHVFIHGRSRSKPEHTAGELQADQQGAGATPVWGDLAKSDDSWLLIRPSGTEPVLRVYAERRSPEIVRALLSYGEEITRRRM